MAAALPLPNFQLLLAGFLRKARSMPDSVGYLTALHGAAFDAVASGDEYVTQTHGESGGNTAERNIPAAALLELCEAGLQVLEAESQAASGIFEQPGSVRYADFHEHPCTLG